MSLGNFTKITKITLQHNNFTGHIPSSLSNLKDLTFIDFSHNNFTGSILVSLGNLTKVTKIMLQYNNFTGHIPSSLSNLKNLTFIDFSHNNFIGSIPVSLGNLTKVTIFMLQYNNFTGQIPSSLSNLKDLHFINFSHNNFGGFGGKISFLTNFTTSQFTRVDSSYNQLASQMCEFQPNNSLRYLTVKNNRLYGSIPNSISNLVNLSFLDVSSNDLNGTVDFNVFKKLKRLRYLNFRANLLHGVLPVPPSSMLYFLISNNRLSGEIPSSICNVTSLEILDISYNSLSGRIPSCLGNFSHYLEVMDLRRNNFYGTMPETFAEGNSLRTLVFNGNHLEGLLPKSLVKCKNLEVLDIGNNKINDSFPYWLEDLPVLQVLILRSNNFNGQLDNFKTESSFSLLRIIDLSHNEFSGSLPMNFFKGLKAIKTTKESKGEVKYMEQLYYQDSIIVAMKGRRFVLERILTIFTNIDLSSNKFHGKIPEEIGMLNFLRGLNLSHNRLTGHIPSSLGHLSVLESLDLSSNRLNGKIPMQLTSLTFLAVLNLSQNQLMGPIPQGKQFGTFQNNSYGGNLGLCGFPLSKNCGINERPPPPIFQEDNDPMFMGGFGWKAVLLGYGCGLVFGIAMGYFIFKIGKPQCLLWLIEENKPRKLKMPSKHSTKDLEEAEITAFKGCSKQAIGQGVVDYEVKENCEP